MADWTYSNLTGLPGSPLATSAILASGQLSDGAPVHLVVSNDVDQVGRIHLVVGSAFRGSNPSGSQFVAYSVSTKVIGAVLPASHLIQPADIAIDQWDNIFVTVGGIWAGSLNPTVYVYLKGVGHTWALAAQPSGSVGQWSTTASAGSASWSTANYTGSSGNFLALTGGTMPTAGSGLFIINMAGTAEFEIGQYGELYSGRIDCVKAITQAVSGTGTAGASVAAYVCNLRTTWVNQSGGGSRGFLFITWSDGTGENGYAVLDCAALQAGTWTLEASGRNVSWLGATAAPFTGLGGLAATLDVAANSLFGSSGLSCCAQYSNHTFRSSATNTTAGATSLGVAVPTGAAAGDAMLATLTLATANAPSPPAGWTLLDKQNPGGGSTWVYLYWKQAATESGTYTWTWTGSVAASAIVVAYNSNGMGSALPTITAADIVTSTLLAQVPATAGKIGTQVAIAAFTTAALTLTNGGIGWATRLSYTPANAGSFFVADAFAAGGVAVGAPNNNSFVTSNAAPSSVSWAVNLIPVSSALTVGAWSLAAGGAVSSSGAHAVFGASTTTPGPELSRVSAGNWLVVYENSAGAIQADYATSAAYHAGTVLSSAIPGLSVAPPTGLVFADPVVANQAWYVYVDSLTGAFRKVRVALNVSTATVAWDTSPQAFDASQTTLAQKLRVVTQPRSGLVDAMYGNGTMLGTHNTVAPVPAAPTLGPPAYNAVEDLAAGQPFAWVPDPANSNGGFGFVRQAPGGVPEFLVPGLTNLLSANDASFETGTGTWTGAGTTGSLASSTDTALDGTHSLKITNGASVGTAAVTCVGNVYPAVPGANYLGTVFLKAATTGRTTQAYLSFYNAAGSNVGTSAVVSGTDVTTGWSALVPSGVAPAGTAFVAIVAQTLTTAASEVHYVDCVGIFPARVSTLANANLVPDSDFRYPLGGSSVSDATFQGWNNSQGGDPYSTGPGSATYTAATSGVHNEYLCSSAAAPIPVTPSSTVTVSCYIDATAVTAGSGPCLAVFNTAIGVQYGANLVQAPGQKGVVSAQIAIPGGVSQVRVLLHMDGSTLAAGSTVTFSQPQLTATATLQPYTEGPTWTPGGSSSLVWSTVENWGVEPNVSGITFPPGLWADNDTTYSWWVCTMSALLVPSASPFPFAVTGSALPAVVPSVSGLATSTPSVSWTFTPGTATDVQSAYRVVVGPSGWNPATTTPTWDSGTIASAATGPVVTGASLPTGLAQGAWDWYVVATESNGATSGFVKVSGTIAYAALSTPTVAASVGTDPGTGEPRVTVSLTWVLGAMTGNVTALVVRSDGVTLRSQPTVAASALAATVYDYEAALGTGYTYQAYLIQTSPSFITSAPSAASGSVNLANVGAPANRQVWVSNPKVQGSGVAIGVSSHGASKRPILQGSYPGLGSDTEVIVSDVRRKRTGQFVAYVATMVVSSALQALLDANPATVLLVRRPSPDTSVAGMCMYFLPTGDVSEGPVDRINTKERLVTFAYTEQGMP